jgi:hypothetical protein
MVMSLHRRSSFHSTGASWPSLVPSFGMAPYGRAIVAGIGAERGISGVAQVISGQSWVEAGSGALQGVVSGRAPARLPGRGSLAWQLGFEDPAYRDSGRQSPKRKQAALLSRRGPVSCYDCAISRWCRSRSCRSGRCRVRWQSAGQVRTAGRTALKTSRPRPTTAAVRTTQSTVTAPASSFRKAENLVIRLVPFLRFHFTQPRRSGLRCAVIVRYGHIWHTKRGSSWEAPGRFPADCENPAISKQVFESKRKKI